MKLPYRAIGYTAEECERDMRRLTNGERGCVNPEDHNVNNLYTHMESGVLSDEDEWCDDYNRGYCAGFDAAEAFYGVHRKVSIDPDVWPWPGHTKLPWQVWDEVILDDGLMIYDPDGFRGRRATVVTWLEFVKARNECTLGPRRIW